MSVLCSGRLTDIMEGSSGKQNVPELKLQKKTRILAAVEKLNNKQENVLIPLLLVTMEQLPLSIKIRLRIRSL